MGARTCEITSSMEVKLEIWTQNFQVHRIFEIVSCQLKIGEEF